MPPKLTILNFEKICRICLELTENKLTINMNNIIEMLMDCSTVKVWYKDALPQQICYICFKRLEEAFHLKNQSETSDRELRELLTKEKTNEEYKNEEPENGADIIDSKDFVLKYEYSDNDYEGFSDHESRDGLELKDEINDIKTEANEPEDNTAKVDSGENNLKCDVCGKTFLNKHKLKKHLVAHSNDRPFQCTLCPKAFKEKFILNKHLKTIHADPARKKVCQICGRSIVKTSLERHLKTHENPPSYQCTECTKKFLDADTLEKHFRRVHKKETSFDLYPFLCNTCGKGLISKSELKRHMNSHLKEANFKCTKCGKAYTSHAGLRSHIKVFHLNERPFVCTVCSRAFPTKIILKHHMRTHTGEKPFKCLICTKTFALKCVLQTHMKVHT